MEVPTNQHAQKPFYVKVYSRKPDPHCPFLVLPTDRFEGEERSLAALPQLRKFPLALHMAFLYYYDMQTGKSLHFALPTSPEAVEHTFHPPNLVKSVPIGMQRSASYNRSRLLLKY